MKHVGLAVLAFTALVALTTAPTAAAGDTKCVGFLMETYDNVVVPAGAHCNLLGARVKGNVLVREGGSVSAHRWSEGSGRGGRITVVHGNIEGDHSRGVTLWEARVFGNVQVKGGAVTFFSSVVDGNVQLEGTTDEVSLVSSGVRGGLEVTKATGEIQIALVGVGNTLKLADNVIPDGDSLRLHDMEITYTTVQGDMQVLKNTGPGPKLIARNSVGQGLQCFENALFSADTNTARKREGQCV